MINYKPSGWLALLCSLFLTSTLTATDYYVNSGTGDNTNSGLSGFPVKTIQHAMTLVAANDVVYIEAGDYSADSVNISKSLTFKLNGVVKIGILRMGRSNALLSLSGNTNGQVDISSKLYLDTGNISANNTSAKLRLLDGAKQLNGSKRAFIIGGYAFQFVANASTNFTWHLGNAKDYRPVYLAGMTRSSIGAEDYYAQFNPSSGLGVNTTLDANTRNISILNHWFLSKTSNSVSTTNIQLRFYYDSATNDDHVYDRSNLQILQSASSGPWVVVNTGGSADRSGSISSGVLSSGALGYFVLGNKKGGSSYQGGINTLGNTTDPFVKLQRLENKKCEEDTVKFRAVLKNVNLSTDVFKWDFGDKAAYDAAFYVNYNNTTILTSPDTLAYHVYRVAGSFTASLEVQKAGGLVDKTNFPIRIYINPETNTDGGKWLSYESYPNKGLDTVSNLFVCQGQKFWVVDKYTLSKEASTTKNTESLFSTKITVDGLIPAVDSIFTPPKAALDTFKIAISSSGPYTVLCTRETNNGCIATEKMDIRIFANPGPILDFTPKCETPPLTTINPVNNTPDPEPDNKVVSWDWHYRGTSVINQKINRSYVFSGADPLPNMVKLVVRTNKGCVDSVEMDVKIHPKPFANKANFRNVCFGETTEYDPDPFAGINYGGSIDYYIWYFDRDSVSLKPDTNRYTTYTYGRPDLYRVRLRLVSDENCVTNLDTNLRIHPRPQPEYQTQSMCFGDTTFFRRVLKRYPIEDSMYYRWYIDYKFVKKDTAMKYLFSGPGIYNVTLVGASLVGCSDSATGIVRSFPVPQPTLGLNSSILGNDTFQCLNANRYTFDYNFGLDLYDTIDISRIDFGDSTVEIPATSTVHRYNKVDTFTVQLFVQNINGCADSVTQTLVVWPSPVADFSYEGVCMPDSVLFVDTSSMSTYPITNRYWDFGDGGVDTGSVLIKHPYPNSGPYMVQLIVESSLGCTDTTNQSLDSLVDIPITSWALVGGSMPICKSDSVIFEAQGGDSIYWNIDGDTMAQKAFRTSGTYFFTATNKGKCATTDSVRVFAYTPTDIIPNPDTVIYRGRQVNLYVKNAAYKIKWSPADFLMGDSSKATVKTTQLIDSIRFYVSALDSNGCPDLDSVTIKIIDPPLVKIPNIITPNGDNENQTWNLIDIPDLFLYNIVISDRQGKRVYESENYKNDWAATDFNGNELPNGVYFYHMKNRQTNQIYRGYIQVIR